jgi:hypothetical protein
MHDREDAGDQLGGQKHLVEQARPNSEVDPVRYWHTTVDQWRGSEQQLPLRVFGRLPDTDLRECTEAGVRKASREETAGEFAPTLVSVYVEFAAAA